jgi:hypothetical protein
MCRRLQMVKSSRTHSHHHSVLAVCSADKHVDAGAALPSLLLDAPETPRSPFHSCLPRALNRACRSLTPRVPRPVVHHGRHLHRATPGQQKDTVIAAPLSLFIYRPRIVCRVRPIRCRKTPSPALLTHALHHGRLRSCIARAASNPNTHADARRRDHRTDLGLSVKACSPVAPSALLASVEQPACLHATTHSLSRTPGRNQCTSAQVTLSTASWTAGDTPLTGSLYLLESNNTCRQPQSWAAAETARRASLSRTSRSGITLCVASR